MTFRTSQGKIDLANPEAALIPKRKDGRPSLAWVEFALEELTGLRLVSGQLTGAFLRISKRIGYNKSAPHWHLSSIGASKRNDTNLPIIGEAEAMIEKMI